MSYKLGSLFDGSGGFPLAGTLCGIEPVWASEVEPYPIAVTKSRFPRMKHLGDISKVNGAEIEPVDIITFGSPCQDLSVAGKRAGLKHTDNGDEETTRSGLFMEAVRIIKEMRSATNGEYPRFALWENVPGAFSSNRGEDFRVVLEELIRIVEPSASVPAVPSSGWAYADNFIGDGWSLAYRVLDAQYWGVPQRRRRIYLAADFGGERARSVLFEREGLRGYFETGRTPWQGTPAHVEGSSGADDREGEGFDGYNGDLTGDKSATLGVNCGISTGRNGVIERRAGGLDAVAADPVIAIDKESYSSGRGFDRKPGIAVGGPCATLQTSGQPHAVCYALHLTQDPITSERITPCLSAGNPNNGQACVGVCYDARGNGDGKTVSTITGDHENRVTDYTSVVVEPTTSKPVYCLQGNGIDRADTAGCNGKGVKEDVCYTLNTIDRPAVAYQETPICVADHPTPKVDTEGVTFTLNARDYKAPLCAVIALDRASFNQGQNAQYDFEITDSGVNSTIVAKGPSAVAYGIGNGQAHQGVSEEQVGALNCMHDQQAVAVPVPPRYIVRRLTPTECARLQGFPDRWGEIQPKTAIGCGDIDDPSIYTEEDHHFWLEVRNTHAAINGRAVKDYNMTQMLNWYNKLHTDSSEYKMWGNGISLPTALYVVQGITDALNTPEEEDDSWMD